MAGTISAQEGALRAGSQAVHSAKEQIDTQCKGVRDQIEQMSAFWSGPAGQAFKLMMTQWDEQTTKLNRTLIDLEQALTTTERTQAAVEEEHQASISRIGAMLSGA